MPDAPPRPSTAPQRARGAETTRLVTTRVRITRNDNADALVNGDYNFPVINSLKSYRDADQPGHDHQVDVYWTLFKLHKILVGIKPWLADPEFGICEAISGEVLDIFPRKIHMKAFRHWNPRSGRKSCGDAILRVFFKDMAFLHGVRADTIVQPDTAKLDLIHHAFGRAQQAPVTITDITSRAGQIRRHLQLLLILRERTYVRRRQQPPSPAPLLTHELRDFLRSASWPDIRRRAHELVSDEQDTLGRH